MCVCRLTPELYGWVCVSRSAASPQVKVHHQSCACETLPSSTPTERCSFLPAFSLHPRLRLYTGFFHSLLRHKELKLLKFPEQKRLQKIFVLKFTVEGGRHEALQFVGFRSSSRIKPAATLRFLFHFGLLSFLILLLVFSSVSLLLQQQRFCCAPAEVVD